MGRLRSVLAGAVLPATAACGSGGDVAAPAATVRDSAGVAIVENADPDPAGRLPWTVGPGPAVDIGSLDGDEGYQLFRVRHAWRLDDRRILVTNGGSGEIRVYDETGRHLATWGRRGEGPGEFTFPVRVGPWPGDSVAVWDRQRLRLSVLAGDGAFGRAIDLSANYEGGLLEWVGAFADGTSIFSVVDVLGEPPSDGVRRQPVTAVLLSPSGQPLDTLPRYRGDEVRMRVGDGTINVLRLPFAKGFVAARVGDRIALGPNDRFEVRLHDRSGTLERIVGLAQAPRPATDADLAAELERQLEATPEQFHPGIRASFENAPRPETFPAIDQVLADGGGHLWVRAFQPEAEDDVPPVWAVFDPDGTLLGGVETPAGLTVTQVGEDFVLGYRTDDLGVEHVQMWALTRS